MEQDISKPDYVNARTMPMFKEMLNYVCSEVKIGGKMIKYGNAIEKIDPDLYYSLFNKWVSKCIDENIIYKTRSNDCTKTARWRDEYSDTEKVIKGMEVLKGIV